MKAVEIIYKKIILFLFLLAVISGLTVVWSSSTATNNTGEEFLEPYTTIVTPWYPVQGVGTDFIMGYYINPQVTPISEINFTTLKDAGITDIYVLVTDENYSKVLSEAKRNADAVDIRTHAWVFPGFSHAAEVADMDVGVQLDVETYNMPEYVSKIKAMREATQGVTFSVCVKPERWDGDQYYYLIAPYCDYIVPMLYIADYKEEIDGLKDMVAIYKILSPGKIVVGLETYQSDEDLTPKTKNAVLAEIKAVKPNARGVILFRYGLSEYHE